MKIMGLRGGQWMKDTVQKIIEWQLEYPEGTAAECEAFTMSMKDFIMQHYGASEV